MTDLELRDYYDRTSELEQGLPIKEVKMTFPKPRRLVGIRLEPESLAAIQRLAARKGLNYSTLMRMWITERLRQEKA